MSILIISTLRDYHAVAVRWALRQRGVDAYIWSPFLDPLTERAAFVFSPSEGDWEARSGAIPIGQPVHAVWLRRKAPAQISPNAHDADRAFIGAQNRAFLECLWRSAWPEACWINPQAVHDRMRHKAPQLQEACRVGLSVPDTLISNDPEMVRSFAAKHPQGIILKSFSQFYWSTKEGARYGALASRLSADQLNNDDAIALTPSIYQEYVNVVREFRVTIMDQNIVAAEISVKEKDHVLLDSKIYYNRTNVRCADIPDNIIKKLLKFMKNSGLIFGTFDIVENDNGDFIFLELNEQGQFLWKEYYDPNIKILESFSYFLAEKAGYQNLKINNPKITCSEFEKSVDYEEMLEARRTLKIEMPEGVRTGALE